MSVYGHCQGLLKVMKLPLPELLQGWESHQDLTVVPPLSRRSLASSVSQNLSTETSMSNKSSLIKTYFLSDFKVSHLLCLCATALHILFHYLIFLVQDLILALPNKAHLFPLLFHLPTLLLVCCCCNVSPSSEHSRFAASYLSPVKAVPKLLKSLLPGGKEDREQAAIHQQVTSLFLNRLANRSKILK